MQPFEYSRATDASHALTSGAKQQTKFVAGGTNLVDLVKCEVERPARLANLTPLPLAAVAPGTGGPHPGAAAGGDRRGERRHPHRRARAHERRRRERARSSARSGDFAGIAG